MLPLSWGTTPADLARPLPCDSVLSDSGLAGPTVALDRVVPVRAPVERSWRWLCQLAVAPYSYDWIDNRGRRSPQLLTPGADDLRVGQRIGVVFDLVSVGPGHAWTGRTHPAASRLFGTIVATYAAVPDGPDASHLHCRFVVAETGPLVRARNRALAWGDLVMMRRQLLNLAGLAERDARLLPPGRHPARR